WIDLVALRFACMINGVTSIIMTKADVLDAFEELNVCTAYNINGNQTEEVPFQMERVKIDPVYTSLKGWNKNSSGFKKTDELPSEMKDYVRYITDYLKTPVGYISNGPGRDQIVKFN
ncbi:MAG TPA: adenylosuccinate synthetase, partial [Chitinophagaceae bacterium]